MCCECHFMLILSNIVVLPIRYVECTLFYRETVFTHQPWQQCTCCHAHHSQTHGYRQEGWSLSIRLYMSKAETHANKNTFDCDWQRAGKDQREVYSTCTLFNLLLLSFRPLRLLILLSSHLFIDSLVEERRMFLRPSVSSAKILNEWLYVNRIHLSGCFLTYSMNTLMFKGLFFIK